MFEEHTRDLKDKGIVRKWREPRAEEADQVWAQEEGRPHLEVEKQLAEKRPGGVAAQRLQPVCYDEDAMDPGIHLPLQSGRGSMLTVRSAKSSQKATIQARNEGAQRDQNIPEVDRSPHGKAAIFKIGED